MTIEGQVFENVQKRSSDVVTIANGQAVSTALDMLNGTLVALISPAALTNTTVRFQVSLDNVTFFPLKDTSGNRIGVTVVTAEADAYPLNPTNFLPWRYIKLDMSGNEGAGRTFTLVQGAV